MRKTFLLKLIMMFLFLFCLCYKVFAYNTDEIELSNKISPGFFILNNKLDVHIDSGITGKNPSINYQKILTTKAALTQYTNAVNAADSEHTNCRNTAKADHDYTAAKNAMDAKKEALEAAGEDYTTNAEYIELYNQYITIGEAYNAAIDICENTYTVAIKNIRNSVPAFDNSNWISVEKSETDNIGRGKYVITFENTGEYFWLWFRAKDNDDSYIYTYGSIKVPATETPKSVTFENDRYTCEEDVEITTYVNVTGKDDEENNLTIKSYQSSDEDIAIIESNTGAQVSCTDCQAVKISCISSGTVTLTATASDNTTKGTATVIVDSELDEDGPGTGEDEEEPEDTDANSYTITFNGNGGNTCSPNTKTIKAGNTIGNMCAPSRKGYTFDGWYTASSGGKRLNKDTVIDSDITLFAHWTKKVSNAKTGITTPVIGLMLITISSCVAYIFIKKKKINLD